MVTVPRCVLVSTAVRAGVTTAKTLDHAIIAIRTEFVLIVEHLRRKHSAVMVTRYAGHVKNLAIVLAVRRSFVSDVPLAFGDVRAVQGRTVLSLGASKV